MTICSRGPSSHHGIPDVDYYSPRNERENVRVKNQMQVHPRISGIVGVEIKWHTGTFALMLSSGKCLEIITREWGNLLHLICNFSSEKENRADKLSSQPPFWAFRTLTVLLEEATLKPDELSRLAWELLSLVWQISRKRKEEIIYPFNMEGGFYMQDGAVSSKIPLK